MAIRFGESPGLLRSIASARHSSFLGIAGTLAAPGDELHFLFGKKFLFTIFVKLKVLDNTEPQDKWRHLADLAERRDGIIAHRSMGETTEAKSGNEGRSARA